MKRALSGVAMAALLLAGCGNDDAQADQRRFCELVEQYNKGTGFQQPEEQTPEALAAALRDYMKQPEIAAILDELPEVAPEEVRADVETMVEVADHLAETGESRFEEEEAVEANGHIVEYTSANCAQPTESASPGDGEAPAEDGDAEQPDEAEEGAEQDGAQEGSEPDAEQS